MSQEISCARDRPKQRFLDGNFKSKVKEKKPNTDFRKAAGQGLGKPTKGASLGKRRPLLTYPWAWKSKTTEGYIAKEVPLGPSLIPKGYMAKGACNASPPVTVGGRV